MTSTVGLKKRTGNSRKPAVKNNTGSERKLFLDTTHLVALCNNTVDCIMHCSEDKLEVRSTFQTSANRT